LGVTLRDGQDVVPQLVDHQRRGIRIRSSCAGKPSQPRCTHPRRVLTTAPKRRPDFPCTASTSTGCTAMTPRSASRSSCPCTIPIAVSNLQPGGISRRALPNHACPRCVVLWQVCAGANAVACPPSTTAPLLSTPAPRPARSPGPRVPRPARSRPRVPGCQLRSAQSSCETPSSR